jgi:hypothetical protein
MIESQLAISVAFVTELIILGVLALVPHGVLLVKVCPLFWSPSQDNHTSGDALQT